jgi:hypothetical protein
MKGTRNRRVAHWTRVAEVRFSPVLQPLTQNREPNLRLTEEPEPEPGPNLVEPVRVGSVLVRTRFEL